MEGKDHVLSNEKIHENPESRKQISGFESLTSDYKTRESPTQP